MLIVPSLLGSVEHVWSLDPAVDHAHSAFNWEAYLRERDMKHVPLKEGCQPTVFVLERLERENFLRVFRLPDGLDQANEAVALGLKGVRNITLPDGKQLELKFVNDGHGGKRVSRDSLNQLFEPRLWIELSDRILSLSRLDPLSERGSDS